MLATWPRKCLWIKLAPLAKKWSWEPPPRVATTGQRKPLPLNCIYSCLQHSMIMWQQFTMFFSFKNQCLLLASRKKLPLQKMDLLKRPWCLLNNHGDSFNDHWKNIIKSNWSHDDLATGMTYIYNSGINYFFKLRTTCIELCFNIGEGWNTDPPDVTELSSKGFNQQRQRWELLGGIAENLALCVEFSMGLKSDIFHK